MASPFSFNPPLGCLWCMAFSWLLVGLVILHDPDTSLAQGFTQIWLLSDQKLIISPGPAPINQSLLSSLQVLSGSFTIFGPLSTGLPRSAHLSLWLLWNHRTSFPAYKTFIILTLCKFSFIFWGSKVLLNCIIFSFCMWTFSPIMFLKIKDCWVFWLSNFCLCPVPQPYAVPNYHSFSNFIL